MLCRIILFTALLYSAAFAQSSQLLFPVNVNDSLSSKNPENFYIEEYAVKKPGVKPVDIIEIVNDSTARSYGYEIIFDYTNDAYIIEDIRRPITYTFRYPQNDDNGKFSGRSERRYETSDAFKERLTKKPSQLLIYNSVKFYIAISPKFLVADNLEKLRILENYIAALSLPIQRVKRGAEFFYDYKKVWEHFTNEKPLGVCDFDLCVWKYKNHFPYVNGYQITRRSGVWSAYSFMQQEVICSQLSWFIDRLIHPLNKVFVRRELPETSWDEIYKKLTDDFYIHNPPPAPKGLALDSDFILLEIYNGGEYKCYEYWPDCGEGGEFGERIYNYIESELE